VVDDVSTRLENILKNLPPRGGGNLDFVSYSTLFIYHHLPPNTNLTSAACSQTQKTGGRCGGRWVVDGEGRELNWAGWTCIPPFLESNCGTDWERWRRRPCLIVGETRFHRGMARALRGGSIVSREKGREKTVERRSWASVNPIETTADVLRVGCVVYVGRFQPWVETWNFLPPLSSLGFGRGPKGGEEIWKELPYIIFILHTYTAY